MQACMLCRKSERVFNIFYDNGGNNMYSVKDDMIEFFGEKVEQYLSENDVICNTCMNILDSVAKLKRRLWLVICGHLNRFQDCKPIKLGKIWDKFVTYLQITDDLDSDSITDRNSTPNLLIPKYAVPYEDYIEENNRLRSISRNSYSSSYYCRSGSSPVEREIRRVFKRRGNNWSRKRRTKKSRSRSRTSSNTSRASKQSRGKRSSLSIRPESNLSDSSYQSYYRSQSVNSLISGHNSLLRYKEDGLVTRSISRAQDRLASRLEQYEDFIFKCNETGCEYELFADLEKLTEHKVNCHKMLALYWCDECKFSYISQEDFKRHDKLNHSYNIICCLYCSALLQNQELLQEHLNEHLLHSVPCKYCDKFFLDKKTYDKHVKESHKGKKKRIKRKPQTILDRIDKDNNNTDSTSFIRSQVNEKQFTVRILKQSGSISVQSDSSNC